MREGRDAGFFNDPYRGVGVCFGYDFVTEHECGIEGIRRLLDCDDHEMGIEKRRVNSTGAVNILRDDTGLVCVMTTHDVSMGIPRDMTPAYALSASTGNSVFVWDDRHFGIHAKTVEDRQHLTALYDHMVRGDVAVLKASGLVLTAISTMSNGCIEDMQRADEDAASLKTAHEQAMRTSGLMRTIKRTGMEFYALSPAWVLPKLAGTTAYPVWYWLNPTKQEQYGAGWYTVEELLQWCGGKGPVIERRGR